MVGLLRKDPRALMAAALRMYWWYAAAASAPTNGPTQKIHCYQREGFHFNAHETNMMEILARKW